MEVQGSASGQLLKDSLSVTHETVCLVPGNRFHLVLFAPELMPRLVGLCEGKVHVQK